jgi:uncharacterized membrane protein
MNIKQRFPDEESFKKYIKENIETYTNELNQLLGDKIKRYKTARSKYVRVIILCFLAFLLSIFLIIYLVKFTSFLPEEISVTVSIIAGFFIPFWVLSFFLESREDHKRLHVEFNEVINTKIHAYILAIFDIASPHSPHPNVYSPPSHHTHNLTKKYFSEIMASGLLTANNSREQEIRVDDEIVVRINKQNISRSAFMLDAPLGGGCSNLCTKRLLGASIARM